MEARWRSRRRLAASRNRVLEMIASGADLEMVAVDLLQGIETARDGMVTSILRPDADGRLGHLASPSLPKSYTDAVDGLPIAAESGSCGAAAYSGERVIASDIATDPRWDQHRETALAHGLRACWSTPVCDGDGKLVGTLAAYLREARDPYPDELALLDGVVEIAHLAIARSDAKDRERLGHEWTRSIIETARDAFVSTDWAGTIVEWNPQAERLLGWSRLDALGRRLVDTIIPEDFRDAYARGLDHCLTTGVATARGRRLELVGRRFDGSEIPVQVTLSSSGMAGSRRFNLFIRDITDRKRRERDARGSLAAARALATAKSVEDALGFMLKGLGEELEWDLGLGWLLDDHDQRLRCVATWTVGGGEMPAVLAATTQRAFRVGEGIVGEVCRSGEMTCSDPGPGEPTFSRHRAARDAGLETAVWLPLINNNRTIGVLEFYGRTARSLDEHLVRTVSAIGPEVGSLIARKRAEAELTRERSSCARCSRALTPA